MNNDTRTCPKCNAAKPATLEHFYKGATSKNGLSSWCKTCMKLLSKTSQSERRSEEIKDKGEALAVEWLKANGIPSDVGKNAGTTRWLDVLSWGCVRIEVKLSETNAQGIWSWMMYSVNNKSDDAKPHLILFIGNDVTVNRFRYFLFDVNHPELFNKKTERRKTNVTFNYQSQYAQNCEVFKRHEDALTLIEMYRLKISQEMMG